MATLKQAILSKRMGRIQDPKDLHSFVLQTVVEDIVARKLKEMKNEIDDEISQVIEKHVDELLISELKPKFKGEQGDKPIAGIDFPVPKNGKDGRDGKTPTKDDLIKLINPLIPKIKDGKDADEERVVSKVLSKIPIPKDGNDGSPDTPEQIANKINTLEERIEQNTIKGLRQTLKNLQQVIREKKGGGVGGGGGMGNVVPETFNVGSATTSITLANGVASNGRAIWLNYQGQQQSYGNHFTVSGRVVSLLFTPDDSTFIDVIYIRG